MTFDQVVDRLDVVGPRRPDRVKARCRGPLHKRQDRNPSLNARRGPAGQTLLRCFTGCTIEEICAAHGLKVSDLFETVDPARRPVGSPEYSNARRIFKAARRQQAISDPEIAADLAVLREADRVVRMLRQLAVTASEGRAWELLAEAAAIEREAFLLEALTA